VICILCFLLVKVIKKRIVKILGPWAVNKYIPTVYIFIPRVFVFTRALARKYFYPGYGPIWANTSGKMQLPQVIANLFKIWKMHDHWNTPGKARVYLG